jgi:hypothetical protein
MARDCVELMPALGHERFAVAGHDHGAYAAQSAPHPATDFASRQKMATGFTTLDVTPTIRHGNTHSMNSQRRFASQVRASSSRDALSTSHSPIATRPTVWMGVYRSGLGDSGRPGPLPRRKSRVRGRRPQVMACVG